MFCHTQPCCEHKPNENAPLVVAVVAVVFPTTIVAAIIWVAAVCLPFLWSNQICKFLAGWLDANMILSSIIAWAQQLTRIRTKLANLCWNTYQELWSARCQRQQISDSCELTVPHNLLLLNELYHCVTQPESCKCRFQDSNSLHRQQANTISVTLPKPSTPQNSTSSPVSSAPLNDTHSLHSKLAHRQKFIRSPLPVNKRRRQDPTSSRHIGTNERWTSRGTFACIALAGGECHTVYLWLCQTVRLSDVLTDSNRRTNGRAIKLFDGRE